MTSNDQWGGRVYTHPVTGEQFRSVTTILNAQAKPQLTNWIIKQIADFAVANLQMLSERDPDDAKDLVRASRYTTSKEAADIGDQVHGVIEDLALGRPVALDPYPTYVAKMWEELNEEFEIEVLHSEATIINRTVGYAGSADLMVKIRKRGSGDPFRTAVVDAKSGKSIYGSVALQLVAYAKAEKILLPDGSELPMPPIQETYALHVRPRSWGLIPMRYDSTTWTAFRALTVVDRWTNRDEKNAVGRAVNKGAIARMRSAA